MVNFTEGVKIEKKMMFSSLWFEREPRGRLVLERAEVLGLRKVRGRSGCQESSERK